MDKNRRQLLLFSGQCTLGLMVLPAFGIEQLSEKTQHVLKQYYGNAPIQRGKVTLTMPSLAENGNSVLLQVHVDHPMTEDNYVKSISVLAEKNPLPEVVHVNLTPANGIAQFSTRMRLSASQTITAIATLSDGSHWMATAETIVTLPACVEAFL